MHDQFSFRFATPADVPAVLDLIRQLAAYEHAADEVRATPEILTTWLFDKQAAEALLAVSEDGTVVGMAVFFQNFSTRTGKGGPCGRTVGAPAWAGRSWRSSRASAASAVGSGSTGPAWTGTNRVCASTRGSAPTAWTSGCITA